MRLALVALAVCASGQGAQVLPADRLESGRQAMQSIYNLDYAEADRICRRLLESDPGDPLAYALLARQNWAQQLHTGQGLTIDRFSGAAFYTGAPDQRTNVSPDDERRFHAAYRQAVDSANSRLARNPTDLAARFALGLAHQTRASYEFTMKASWWAAFKEGERALRQHRMVLAAAPDFADARLAKAVSDYAVDSVPWSIRWVPFLLGYSGSKAAGKRELGVVANRGAILADDARTLLVLLHSLDGEYALAAGHVEGTRPAPSAGNYLIPLELAAIALYQHQPQRALAIYQTVLTNIQNRRPGYTQLNSATIFLRLGVASREAGDQRASIDWLQRALAGSSANSSLQVTAHLELGKTLDLQGERARAVEQYTLVAHAPDFLGSRREARTVVCPAGSGSRGSISFQLSASPDNLIAPHSNGTWRSLAFTGTCV